MKIAVVGSRTFNNYNVLKIVLDQLRTQYNITTIVSGGANGADNLAERYADEKGIQKDIYPAEWSKYGKRAGFMRNQTIWDNSDMGVAFWDGQSKGTAHSFEISKRQNKILFIFDYSKNDFYELN